MYLVVAQLDFDVWKFNCPHCEADHKITGEDVDKKLFTCSECGEGMSLYRHTRFYTEKQKERQGEEIAQLLMLRKSKEYKDRYLTSWGTKTAIGVFEVVRRIGREIEEGTFNGREGGKG